MYMAKSWANFDLGPMTLYDSSACKYLLSLLVLLSKTKATYSLLTGVFDTYPTILGSNFDISSMEFSRSSGREYPIFFVGLAQNDKSN